MYYFVKERRTKGVIVPKLPKKVEYLLLAEIGNRSKYSLYECKLSKKIEIRKKKRIKAVSKELKMLIDCAKRIYPPALALMRRNVVHQLRTTEKVSLDVFEENLVSLLNFHLSEQKDKPYFLAKSSIDEIGYLSKGNFYWIISYCPSLNLIYWVSDDFFIYQNPPHHFEVNLSVLVNRFGLSLPL